MLKKLFLICILGTAIYSKAQDKAELALQTFDQKYPQEKIHLLLNKSSYVAGETLWFKSFVFNGYSPSGISTSLFVELYDSNKVQIGKKLVPLLNGEGSGSITLSESLKENVYYIRAYTSWMANFSEDFQAIQPIAVYNPSSPEKLSLNTASAWTASVYPESGTFIDGINTKFAVRLQSKGITPSDWNGYVIDTENPNTKIVTFKGFDQNVGSFSLTPKSGKKYQLIVEDSKGTKQNIDLPLASGSGINLQVQSNTDAIKFSLKSKNLSQESQYYKVLGTINNQLVYKAKISKITDQTYSIPTEQLVNGILQLTVFDDKENIIAQRLSFVQPDLLKIKKPAVQPVSLNESPRASNSLKIVPENHDSNYTVLVLDGSTNSTEEESSLLSTLWLTGDIHSAIVSPAQYFTKEHNSEALDALLISEKWKRFDWRNIISGVFPVIKHPSDSYISYKGKVTVQGQPAPNTDLNLLFQTPDKNIKFFQIKTNANGFFMLNNLIFEDSIKFSYQLNNEKIPKEQVQVIFQPNFAFIPYNKSLPQSKYILTSRTTDEQLPAEVVRAVATKSIQKTINEKIVDIEEVKIKVQKKDLTKKLNNELSSPMFKSANETIFDLVNDNNSASASSNILKWLQGRVAGLTIESYGGDYHPKMRGSSVPVYLDEMQVNASQISLLSVSDVAMVKVIRGYFAGGFGGGGGNGAIAIYTKRGGSTGSVYSSAKSSQMKQITLNGYDAEAPFNNPTYDNESFKSISQDTRSVLYWSPYVEAVPNEPTTIQFYNNDDAKNYRVIIMGYDKNSDLPLYYNEVLK